MTPAALLLRRATMEAVVAKYSGGKKALDFASFCALYDMRPTTSCSQVCIETRAHVHTAATLTKQLRQTTARSNGVPRNYP